MNVLEISPSTTIVADKIVSVQKAFCQTRVSHYVSLKMLGGFEERIYCSEDEAERLYTDYNNTIKSL